MVQIQLHGDLGVALKRQRWNLEVKSVAEAIHAINTISKQKLYKYLYEKERGYAQYQVLINKRPFYSEHEITEHNLEEIVNSELSMNVRNLKTIDIVPVISGASIKDIIGIIIGVVLIIAGIFTFGSSSYAGVALIVGGIGLIAAGIINLLSKPPRFEDFREIDGSTGRNSYLFNGPQNTTREGGPVPVGYGQLIVGSQVISASYIVDYVSADQDAPSKIGDKEDAPNVHFAGTNINHDNHDDHGKSIYEDQTVLPYKYYFFMTINLGGTGNQQFRSYSSTTTLVPPHIYPFLSTSGIDQAPNLKTLQKGRREFLLNGQGRINIFYAKEFDSTTTDGSIKARFVIIREFNKESGRFRNLGFEHVFYLVPNSENLKVEGLFDQENGNYAPIWRARGT